MMAELILATDDTEQFDAPTALDPLQNLDRVEQSKRIRSQVTTGPLTEQWLAERMVHRHGKDLRYCVSHGWLAWTSQRWRRDDLLEVERRTKETVLSLYHEASNIGDDARRKAVLDFARSSETNHRRNGVIALARSEPGITIRADDLDCDPWLLNCENGTIDLRTGKLRPHERDDLITKIAPVAYDPDTQCPQWMKFLNDIFAGDKAMIGFVQRALGHALTGVVRDHILHVLYGTGANGKSTLTEAMIGMLGDYAMMAAPGLLLRKRNEQHPTERAALWGKRLIACMETGEGRRLDEELVKQLTGNDTITARFMRADFFSFKPSHKLLLGTNHKPEVRGTDHAIWRRIQLWPFAVTIPDAQQDHELPDKLKTEWPGILRWCVDGCLEWQRVGLAAPQLVTAATAAYRAESDRIASFVDEHCTIDPDAKVAACDLYASYKAWAESGGEETLKQKRFGEAMTERGYSRVPFGPTRRKHYLGIGLVSSEVKP